MNILITGANGQLGNELTSMLSSGQAEIGPIPAAYRGSRVTAVDVDRLDITDSAAVQAFIEAEKPELIINCAAMTNVNGCESAPDTAMKINAIAPRFLAAAAQEIGAKLVHVSTDYVLTATAPRQRRLDHPLYRVGRLHPLQRLRKIQMAGRAVCPGGLSPYLCGADSLAVWVCGRQFC